MLNIRIDNPKLAPYDFSDLKSKVKEIRKTVNVTSACDSVKGEVSKVITKFIADIESLRSKAGAESVDSALKVINPYAQGNLTCSNDTSPVQEQLDKLEELAIERAGFVRVAFCQPEKVFLESGLKFAKAVFENFPDFLMEFGNKEKDFLVWKLNLTTSTQLDLIRSNPYMEKTIETEDFEETYQEFEDKFNFMEGGYTVYAMENRLSFVDFKGENLTNECPEHVRSVKTTHD